MSTLRRRYSPPHEALHALALRHSALLVRNSAAEHSMRVVKKILKKKGKRAPGTRSLPPATTLPKRPPLGGKRRECSLVAFPWSPMVALLFAMRPKPHRRCPQKPHCIHASCGAASAFDASTGKPHRDLRDPEAVSVVSVGVVSCLVKGWHNRRSSSRWRETCRGHRDDG